MTFSIVGRSDDGTSWGVAVASKFLAVGSAVPAAAAGSGAVATQADANVSYKPRALALLRTGASAATAMRELLADDDLSAHRQVGLVDAAGGSATHTGAQCLDWAGGASGAGYAIQGNVLTGPAVVAAMERSWTAGDATRPLAHRLLDALRAGDDAGGDRRGRQAAALLVVRAGAGYGGLDDTAVDLRVDDHPTPVGELTRLLTLNDLYLTASDDADKVPVTAELAAELERRAGELGQRSFMDWVGMENYEMRVAKDGSWIDRRVLAIIRGGRTGT